jgi:hypothetical protein
LLLADYQQGRLMRLFKTEAGTWDAALVVTSAGFTIPVLAGKQNTIKTPYL